MGFNSCCASPILILRSAFVIAFVGQDVFEIQADAIKAGQTVVVIDDLIATGMSPSFYDAPSEDSYTFLGGSAKATGELITKQGGKLLENLFVIELTFLQGTSKLDSPSYSLIKLDD